MPRFSDATFFRSVVSSQLINWMPVLVSDRIVPDRFDCPLPAKQKSPEPPDNSSTSYWMIRLLRERLHPNPAGRRPSPHCRESRWNSKRRQGIVVDTKRDAQIRISDREALRLLTCESQQNERRCRSHEQRPFLIVIPDRPNTSMPAPASAPTPSIAKPFRSIVIPSAPTTRPVEQPSRTRRGSHCS